MANLAEIQTAVQRQFGDDTEAQITLDDITRWVNEAMLVIARRTDVLLGTFSTNSSIGTSVYPLPVDFLRIDRVTFNGMVLKKTTPQDLDVQNPTRTAQPVMTGNSYQYYVRQKAVVLYPAPDRVAPIDVVYARRPATTSYLNDTIDLPVELHDDLVRFCLARAYELDGAHNDAQSVMGGFDQNLGWAIDETSNPYTDSYPMIRET